MRKRPVTRADFVKLGLLVAYAAWVLFQPDDALYPELADVPVPQTSIAAEHASDLTVGLLGLEAPAGTDFMAFGRAMLVPAKATESMEDRFRRLANGKPRLEAMWPADMECWRYASTDAVLDAAGSQCASPEALQQVLDRNGELLQRYRQIRKFPVVSLTERLPAISHDMLAGLQPLVTLSKLNTADIANDARNGNFEQAWRNWAEERTFQNRMAGLANNWHVKAINLVNEGSSFAALEILLKQAPQLMDSPREELLSLLQPRDLSFYNLTGVMRAEGALLAVVVADSSLPMRPNRLRNRHEDFSRDLVAAVSAAPVDIAGTVARVKHDHEVIRFSDAFDPMGFVAWRKALEGQVKTGELIASMQNKETQRRLFTIRVMLARDKVPDADIDEFLRNVGPELRSPVDGQPFKWIPSTRAIAPAVPGKPGALELRL